MVNSTWTSRLHVLISVGLLVVAVIFIVSPLQRLRYVRKGYCHITGMWWINVPCRRTETETNYYFVPNFSGRFWEHMNPDYVEFTALTYDKHYADKTLYEKIGLSHLNSIAFLVDDLTEDALINCLEANTSSMKQKVVEYLPLFKGILNTTSLTDNNPDYFPERFIDCYYEGSTDVYLNSQTMSKWMIFVFLFTLFLLLVGVVRMAENEPDGPFKELLQMASIPIYIAHTGFYVLFVLVIAWGILNIEPKMEIEEAFRKGSVLIPFIWLWKKMTSICSTQSDNSHPD